MNKTGHQSDALFDIGPYGQRMTTHIFSLGLGEHVNTFGILKNCDCAYNEDVRKEKEVKK